MPILQKFCFCCELRTGSILIGWINLIADIIAMILLIVGLVDLHKQRQSIVGAEGVIIAGVVGLVIDIIMCILLLIGVKKDRRQFVFAWVVWSGILLVFGIIIVIMEGVKHVTIGSIIINVIRLAFRIYCILTVYSFYQLLKESGPQSASSA